MIYQPVLVYDLNGDFLGYAIKGTKAIKLQSNNLYLNEETNELEETVRRLNNSVTISEYWPNASDPEVVALLADESFYPIERADQEVVDDDNSYLVYDEENEILDQEKSVIAYKTINLPVRPSDAIERTKAACEKIAKKRAGI